MRSSSSKHLDAKQDVISFVVNELRMELGDLFDMLFDLGFAAIFNLPAVFANSRTVLGWQFDCNSGDGFKRYIRAAI